MDNSYEDDTSVLDILREIFVTERQFYNVVRFLDGGTRNNVVAAHLRNVNHALALLRMTLEQPQPTTITMNIPINMDLSGNFFDPVPVVPTPAQIATATETHVGGTDMVCAICQDSVTCATRIRACGHCFHAQCISQWLGMNARCPVCRHDIRLTNAARSSANEGGSMHADE